VVTLMTDAQVADVRDLTRKAGITATVTKLRPGHPLLDELAPGERAYVAPDTTPNVTPEPSARRPRHAGGKPRAGRPQRGNGRSAKPATQPATQQKKGGMATFSAGTRAGRRR
jgi:hypothetical protein